MKNKGAKQKLKRKGAASAFGCDLTEYLESSGQDVPYVLKSCAEFIETHGIVDGIYRLSGVTSNIQRLRQEFGSDQCPDLTREVYLQDIHCVGSLCKLYFRELPNPLLTYELYEKFTEAVSHCPEEGRLARIQNVIQELPPSHYRTLEYLIRHLAHIASFSSQTNMHARNLALVWAPNLLRSKEIEATGCNGDAAFLAVRVQQVVIEFILNHVDQIFNSGAPSSVENDENRPIMKSLTLPALSLPMKLVSLEEAQARSLATNHPARKERRENSLPEIVPPMGTLFHTVLELPDNKRKLSSKSKKWKSIFNLGRSGSDSKSKLSRNGSVFVRGQRLSVEKATIRPAKSMDSLCSVPVEGKETKGNFNRTVTTGGFFIPATKMHGTSTGSSCDLSKQEGEWGHEGMLAGAEGGVDVSSDRSQLQGAQARPPPEQLKVFRPAEDPESEQTAPKMLGMFYTSNDSPSKSVFTSSLFQMEPSPRHQRKALNISEPFAVSVPLRVSAVISTNSTPCRTPPKELQSLSSLEEFSFQGSEGGGWPEEEKPLGAESSPAAVPKKAAHEDAKAVAEAAATPECSQGPSLEPGPQLEEKTLEILLGSQHSREPEKGPNAEKVVEDAQEAGWKEPESPRARAEAVFLHEMDEDDLAHALIWPEIQQELKIIESEEELSSLPPPALRISAMQPSFESKAGPFASSEPPRGLSCGPTPDPASAPPEEWTRDPRSESTQGASTAASGETPEPTSGLQRSKPEQGVRLDPARLAPLEIMTFEMAPPQAKAEVRGPGNLSPPLPPAPPPPTPLEEAPGGLLAKDGPEREASSRDLRTKPSRAQLECKDSSGLPHFCQAREAAPRQSEQQHSKDAAAAAEGTDCALPSPTKEAEMATQGEGDGAHSLQEPSDCDEDDTMSDSAQHGLEMVEPWEEPQWVTSPLHSPTLKDVQEAQVQGPQGPRLEKRLSHRPSLRQSHSLDSKSTGKSQWTPKVPSSSSCANLETQRNSDPLQPLAPRSEVSRWDEKALKSFREFSSQKGREAVPSQKGPGGGGVQPALAAAGPASPAEGQELRTQVEPSDAQSKQGGGSRPESSKESSPSGQDSSPPAEHSPKLQLKSLECGPPKGKNRPSSLNLDSTLPIADLFRLENAASFSSPGVQLSERGEPKATWMASPHCKADPWKISPQDPQDLDLVAHALTGRRNSAPVSVSAVRTSFMVKMCQARAVPVIPPKIQYTQIPQPLPSQSSGEGVAQPLEKSREEPSSPRGLSHNPAKGEPPSSPESPKEEKPEQDLGAVKSTPADASVSCICEGPTLPPDPDVPNLLSTHDATVQCRKRTSETEPSGDNLLSSKIERPSGSSKPFHRSRPGRPQSLILFSPPFPIMDHLPPSSTVTDSKVLLSPIRSPTQTVSPGLLCGELAENTWVTPEGVTLRNKMTIPKNGQRLETSTSCFYQPQRRSVILDGRSGRQIE